MFSKRLANFFLVGLAVAATCSLLSVSSSSTFNLDVEGSEDVSTDDSDSLCPRSREEASTRGRQCLRKCKTDADCISSRKRCLCDGLCGWSCVRPDLNCNELPPVTNGNYKVSGDYFGARVTYSCDDGFYMSGSRERICQGDGSWSDQAPECKKEAMCGGPLAVPHARHTATADQGDFPIDSMVQYNCFVGYESKGFAKAKCLFYNGTAQWFGPDLKCIPRSCGHPGELENGQREGSIFTFTSKVTYHCAQGYELVGRANRYCQSNGQWSGVVPSCRPVQCSLPEEPANGRALYSSVTYNSAVKYECRYGFKLLGPSSRTCGAAKAWEGDEPKCTEIDCGSPGILHNGYLEGRRTILGSVIYFRCFEGMIFKGPSNSTTCSDTGQWSSPLPGCMAPCIVPEVEHGRVNEVAPGLRVPHDQDIKVDCKPQFELTYNSTSALCNNGTWTHVPHCVPARCKQLPERPKNGLVIAPKTEHGMKALYRCRDGYTLVGPNVTTCNFGKWTETTPTCQEIYCPFPGFLESGRVLLVGHMGMYDYRPYVRKVTNNKQIVYECDKGFYVFGSPGATCVDGQWSPRELPRCLRGSHPHLTWLRRRRRSLLINNAISGPSMASVAAIRTNDDSPAPLNMRQLRAKSEQFGGSPVAAVQTTAVAAGTVTEARLRTRRNSAAGDHEEEEESEGGGDLIIGKRQRTNFGPDSTIVSNSKRTFWLRNLRGRRHPRAKAPCKALSNTPWMDVSMVKLGSIGSNDTHPHGTIVKVSCSNGYALNLGSNRTARCVRGFWKPKEPECTVSPCKVPASANGVYYLHHVKLVAGVDSINHGEAIHLQCSQGFQSRGSHSTRCWFGNWTAHQTPECLPAPCVLPDIANGDYVEGYRPGLTISHGSFVQYKCKRDFTQGTQVPPRCIEARLMPEPPHCIGHELLDSTLTMVHGAEAPGDTNGEDTAAEDEEESDDLEESLEESASPLDEAAEENMIRKMLETDEEVSNMITNSKMRSSQSKWCENPERLENVLKYPYAGSEETLGDIGGGEGLPLISVAEISRTAAETTEISGSGGYGTESGSSAGGAELRSMATASSWSSTTSSNLEFSTSGSVVSAPSLSPLAPSADIVSGPGSPVNGSSSFSRLDQGPNGQTEKKGIHPPGTEILFRCVPVPGPGPFVHRYLRKTTWRLTCKDDGWIGKPEPCDEDEDIDLEELANRTCIYAPETTKGDNVLAFHGDRLLDDYEEFPPGTQLVFRCADIGKYAMTGSVTRKCTYGDWDSVRPSCTGLSQEHDYALEKSPTILFRHQLGPIAQSNDGKLIVYPGIILHLECLWIRKYGVPTWEVNHSSKDYTQGWTTEAGRDSSLEYRLSIYHTTKDDSGVFTCVTPVKHRHSVDIVVKAVHCPALPPAEGLTISDASTKMNTRVAFKCREGMRLTGPSEAVCLPSGTWSSPAPSCYVADCPEISNPSDNVAAIKGTTTTTTTTTTAKP